MYPSLGLHFVTFIQIFLPAGQSFFVTLSAYIKITMLSKSFILSLLASSVAAAGVTGTAFGFAAATTGGGDAEPVYPTTTEELTGYLTDDEARVIILNQEFNFIGTEGEVTEDGCRPDSNTCPGDGGQDAINGADWVCRFHL